MNFEISRPYAANELFTLNSARRIDGLPEFANLKADRLPQWKGSPAQFQGPGIYGVFCKGELYYVGIYTGEKGKTFAGSVLQRWYMHLTYHSVRSPRVKFARRELQKILANIHGEPADTIARLLGGRTIDVDQLTPETAPLVEKSGGSCTSNKVRFAQKNWDVFAPGNEHLMGSEVSFVYGRFLPDNSSLLGLDVTSAEAYSWAKYQWLQAREARLVNLLKPICNAVTSDYQEGIFVASFVAALTEEMALPLQALPVHTVAA
ncbi:hypothetical protein [Devosia sp. FJ2-5-3]|uniref:hypothetical protein n=1 Tax=Devosia sp. FJ2-5-3 TaxID=2976680 RepID=UPI0023D874C3|nr:hypothetical protein [Devosia sp. FJ2-5-3]WEJ56903.1 hypothetical protein N0P34_11820 [Devosia sp. FJ2-5-3]